MIDLSKIQFKVRENEQNETKEIEGRVCLYAKVQVTHEYARMLGSDRKITAFVHDRLTGMIWDHAYGGLESRLKGLRQWLLYMVPREDSEEGLKTIDELIEMVETPCSSIAGRKRG